MNFDLIAALLLGVTTLAHAAPIPLNPRTTSEIISLVAPPPLLGDAIGSTANQEVQAASHYSTDETSGEATEAEELRTRMDFDGTLFDIIRGVSRTLREPTRPVPSLDKLNAQTPHSHVFTHNNELAHGSDELLRAPIDMLPGQSSMTLSLGQREPPPASSYDLLSAEGTTAYQRDHGVDKLSADRAYTLERQRQVYRARLKNDADFLQKAALKSRLNYQMKRLSAQLSSDGEPGLTQKPPGAGPLDSAPIVPPALPSSLPSSAAKKRKTPRGSPSSGVSVSLKNFPDTPEGRKAYHRVKDAEYRQRNRQSEGYKEKKKLINKNHRLKKQRSKSSALAGDAEDVLAHSRRVLLDSP